MGPFTPTFAKTSSRGVPPDNLNPDASPSCHLGGCSFVLAWWSWVVEGIAVLVTARGHQWFFGGLAGPQVSYLGSLTTSR